MKYRIDVSYKSLNKYGEELCGDNVEVIRTDDSVILVLADGLGSGVKANILSKLSAKIIGTMIKEGAKIEDAVETIAKTLPICKIRRLAYSTFSILQFFYSGEAYLVEFDNPKCIFIRDGEVIDISSIQKNISGKIIKESRFCIKQGDVFALISDGVIHAGIGKTLNLGWKWENAVNHLKENIRTESTAARLATSLSEVCNNLYMNKPGDDTTVAVAKITNESTVNIFTGPPEDKGQDIKLIRDFMRSEGKKVVCGGTGANIAARVLHRELTTSVCYEDSDIPPIGHIKGIDLVTEGVLTMTRVVNLLKQYVSNNIDRSFFMKLDEKNGAALLAKLLLEECTHVNFFVGKAINPAHQNPGLPVDLSIKLRIIEELCFLLKLLNKNITVAYY